MAKHKDDDAPKSPKEMEVEASEAKPAKPGESASVKGDKATGTPVYPPPASDRSGERTANVPPSKQLPTKAPGESGADELTRLKAERDALAGVVRNLGGNPDEVAKAATAKFGDAATDTPDTSKPKWLVTPVGETDPVEVHADDEASAVEAFKAKRGLWHLGAPPAVKKAGK